ncbi:MAG: hypothetical protein OXG15_02435 [Gammaproteobacteria bacterium]|nr:hypothetical protein [Gammaproteobacteria bacterium]
MRIDEIFGETMGLTCFDSAKSFKDRAKYEILIMLVGNYLNGCTVRLSYRYGSGRSFGFYHLVCGRQSICLSVCRDAVLDPH